MPYPYHIYHSTGFHIVTIQADDDKAFWNMILNGQIHQIKQYTYLQVYTEKNPKSEYPDISTRPENPSNPSKSKKS